MKRDRGRTDSMGFGRRNFECLHKILNRFLSHTGNILRLYLSHARLLGLPRWRLGLGYQIDENCSIWVDANASRTIDRSVRRIGFNKLSGSIGV
jgi:hypothetical protein